MSRRSEIARAAGFACAVVLIMLMEWLRRMEVGMPAIRSLQEDIIDATLSKPIQIAIVIILLVYFVVFFWKAVRGRQDTGVEKVSSVSKSDDVATGFWRSLTVADGCKIGLVLFSLAACWPAWRNPAIKGTVANIQLGIDQTTNALVFLTGLVIGCIGEWLMNGGTKSNRAFGRMMLVGVPLFLAATSLLRPTVPHAYKYHNEVRWTGLWVNPNTYGLLMGVGLVLAVHSAIEGQERLKNGRRRIWVSVCLLEAVLCGFGLLKSYSRGALLASACGLAFIAWNTASVRIRRNLPSASIALVSLLALAFWQFRFSEWLPARRAFSVANINDFSWRNRVTAWCGALQMMKDRPWLGFGWAQAETVYAEKYRPPQLENGAAIQMNDYFTLGISAGIPALICFLICVGWTLRSPHSTVGIAKAVPDSTTKNTPPEIPLSSPEPTLDWIQSVCRPGVMVLLVGFWFDGGLFKLATGSFFWILLGTVRSTDKALIGVWAVPGEESRQSASRGYSEIWLKRAAGAMAAIALLQTVILVGTPFLSVNKETLRIARKWLVPPKAISDLDFLAGQPIWGGRELKVLVTHASLANYNRELINWKLDDRIYRHYVLWPDVHGNGPDDPGLGIPNSELVPQDLNWRRELWEFFYPQVRKELDAESAAEIVMKFLHQRMAIVSQGPLLIEEMWQQKRADTNGYEALKVAAFRSVGIPTRLNDEGRAEFFADEKWQMTQHP